MCRELCRVSRSQIFTRTYSKHEEATLKLSAFKSIYKFSIAFTHLNTCINIIASFILSTHAQTLCTESRHL